LSQATLRCALVEAHSWPSGGAAGALSDGERHYCLRLPAAASDRVEQSAQQTVALAVIPPWSGDHARRELFLVADELCASHLPTYLPRANRVALIKESPNLVGGLDAQLLRRRFDCVFTHQRHLVELGEPFVLLPYSSNFVGFQASDPSWRFPAISDKTRLCSLIAANDHDQSHQGYRLRSEVCRLLEGDPRIDRYGRDSTPLADKADGLRSYAFSIAMENAKEDYYFTEKLIDCLLLGVIPLYWGCPSIGRFFDPRGILSFSSVAQLQRLLESISLDRYRQLRRYAEANVATAIAAGMADLPGYFGRALALLLNGDQAVSMATGSLQAVTLRFGPRHRLAAALRRWVETSRRGP